MSQKDVNRQVHFIFAPIFDPEDSTGVNNTWVYHRAPDGYLFILDSIQISTDIDNSRQAGVICIFDGHEYTHWNLWPGVESRETLWRGETSSYSVELLGNLNGWICKEYTIGIRSASETKAVKYCAIVWFYLKKASREELLEYALKHPKDEDAFKRALRGRTAETEEL